MLLCFMLMGVYCIFCIIYILVGGVLVLVYLYFVVVVFLGVDVC